ncbi:MULTISPECIES: phage holin family protein [unclassified Streptomyces]|uniref:phage holin family protein n=1 Tax=unclassified Streptomyces TaxID=2593676 RepID=UPI004042B342
MRARGEDDPASGADRIGDAANRLAQDAADLARRELRAVQDEAMAGLRRLTVGGTMLTGAGLCGILAVSAVHETVLRATEKVLPRTRAAALLAGLYTAAAVGLGLTARNRIRAAAEAAAEALERGHATMPTTTDALDRTAPEPPPESRPND